MILVTTAAWFLTFTLQGVPGYFAGDNNQPMRFDTEQACEEEKVRVLGALRPDLPEDLEFHCAYGEMVPLGRER